MSLSLLQTLKSFVNERLSAAAEEIFEVVERIITEYEDHYEDLDIKQHVRVRLQEAELLHPSVCKEGVSPEEQERNPSLVQEEPDPPQIKEEQQELLQRPEDAADGSTLTLLAVKHEGDDDENRGTEPLINTSTEHMKTQPDVETFGKCQPTTDDQFLSSLCFESVTEDCDEWEDTREAQSGFNTLKSHKTQNVEGQRSSSFSNKPSHSQDLNTKQTPSTSHSGDIIFTANYMADQKKHIRTCKVRKPCTCAVCGKVFGQMGDLKRHMRIHTGEKPFTCPLCEKSFNRDVTLKRHMMTHTAEKPFMCIVCEQRFSLNHHLKRHMRTHTGEKPFMCTFCVKGFSQMGDLTRHMRIHTGDTCPVWEKNFSRNVTLQRHMRIHTGEQTKKT